MIKDKLFGCGLVLLLVFSISLIKCGCSGDSPESPQMPDQVKENPSFAQDIQSIFNNNCISGGCHANAASAGMNLMQGQSYANLVNVNSTLEPGQVRVVPNDSQNSYLVLKLEGRQQSGLRMPLGRNPLSNSQIQNIKNWIDKGANDN